MGNRGIAPPFLTSVLHGGLWSVSRHDRFSPGERIGDWVGPRGSLNTAENQTPAVQLFRFFLNSYGSGILYWAGLSFWNFSVVY
jgi:hypothetical protein